MELSAKEIKEVAGIVSRVKYAEHFGVLVRQIARQKYNKEITNGEDIVSIARILLKK